MPFPFEVPFSEVESHLDAYINAVFGALQSEFLNLPKGNGFIDYATFVRGYEELKLATNDFREINPESVISAVYRTPICFIVLRTILGFTPPEWAYITAQRTQTTVTQGAARALDRQIRLTRCGRCSTQMVLPLLDSERWC